jgi:hypothetical protein
MYPHRIRLRGPWQCTPMGEKPRRITVPCEFTDPITAPVLLTRSFGYPGRIDEHERVWITAEYIAGSATITLNGQVLGEAHDGPFEADVTALLGPHNCLEILTHGSQVGEVAMEVRAIAFLKGIRVRRLEGKLQVQGTVAGTCAEPLELYVLVDGRHTHYQTIDGGASFTAVLDTDGQVVRVELVHVSEVWHAVEAMGEW